MSGANIRLESANVTVQWTAGDRPQAQRGLYVAADYDRSVELLLFSFNLHVATEAKGAPIPRLADVR